MYDTDIINNYLGQLTPSIIINSGKTGEKEILFELTRHSVPEVQEMNNHLDSLIKLDLYKATCETNSVKLELKGRQLGEDELIWMENERLICQYDCNYFMDRYYKILSAEGKGWEQFSPLVPQRVNRRIRARLQRAQRAIRKWTVKARQQGETTDSQGVILQRLNYFSDTNSLVSSMDSTESGKMTGMFTKAHAQLPYWNRTFIKKLDANSEYNYDNGSTLDIGWGTQEKLGRGRTPHISHLSEIPFYKHPQKALEESLFHGMHESIWQIMLCEGTAEERGDYYHKKTLEVIEGMSDSTGSFVICFHPWCARRDLFPTDTWIRARSSAFANWSPSTQTIAHANKLRQWVLNNEDYRAEFGPAWHLDREQMFYYEIEKNAAEKRGALQAFLKEKPSDIEEAFQNAGQSIYPLQTIISISDRAQGQTPEVYKLRGDTNEINPLLFPSEDERNFDKPIIEISAKWDNSLPRFHYELVPIKFMGWQNFDPQNKFLIWEHPRDYAEYALALDDSDGLGKDISDDAVFELLKKGTVEFKDKQVCEFASAELPPDRLRPYGLAIGTYYSPLEQLLLVPEIKKGTEFLNAMINVGWSNIFRMLDMTRIDKNIVESRKVGFDTNAQSRPELINHMNSFILGDFVEIYSIPLIQELKDLTKKKTKSPVLGLINEKILAGANKSDNRFMSFGMALYALHRNEILGLEQAAWKQRIANENSTVILKSYRGSSLDIIDIDNEGQNGYYEGGLEAEMDLDNLMTDIFAFSEDD